ncbi:MAG: glycosyl hydrolase 53 family protein [Eubacterium sp.]|nr:glycosyl hydrolase 53 family protein [Eubacterium sp.]
MKRKEKTILTLLITLSLLLALFNPLCGTCNVVSADDNFLTFYYQYTGDSNSLYCDIWNSATGFTFSSDFEKSDVFSWGKNLALLKSVKEGSDWYYITFNVEESFVPEFSIYTGEDSANALLLIDSQWNNTSICTDLSSGASSVYCYTSNGEIYTSTEDAGISFDDESNNGFTLYYQYKGSDTLYCDIWNDTSNFTFAEDAVKENDPFGWGKTMAKFSPAGEGNGWFYTTFSYTDSYSFGLSIYGNSSSTPLMEIDGEWNNTDIYNSIIGGESNVYCIDANGNLYENLSDAISAEDASNVVQNAEIEVSKVSNLSDDFALGFDISAIDSIYQSGAYCSDYDGNPLSEEEFFKFIADQGINWVRIRVWNNPYDSLGNGFGGGNNDLEKACKMGKYASDAGMKVFIDFHFSDFWADPGKQKAPRDWSSYSIEEKAGAVSNYTTSALKYLYENGVDVGMVQIGNETNGGFCGVTGTGDWTGDLDILFDAGCDAVHSYAESIDKEILAVVHFTNPEKAGREAGFAANLAAYDGDGDGIAEGVSYDVFASSYYPFWHGSLSNLKSVLSEISSEYNKKVMVAETSYAWTLEDGDGHGNTISASTEKVEDCIYPYNVNGQAKWVRDLVDTVNKIENGIGVFYWEAAWIPVSNISNLEGEEYENALGINKELWEKYGSGWAASYAKEYDPDDAGKWYGGSAIDNQAFFDFDGKALDSLRVYTYMKTGSEVSDVYVDGDDISVDVEVTYVSDGLSQAIKAVLPSSLDLVLSNANTMSCNVVWNEEEIEAVDGVGIYEISGKVTLNGRDYGAVANLNVNPGNLLIDENYSFEDGNNKWSIEGNGVAVTSDDPYEGSYSLHYYNGSDAEYNVLHDTISLEPGVYTLEVFGQGRLSDEGTLFIKVGDEEELTASYVLENWNVWQNPRIENIIIKEKSDITFGVRSKYSGGGWGTIDNFYLYKPLLNLEKVEAIEPTCVDDGNIEYYYCQELDLYFSDEGGQSMISQDDIIIPANGNHSWDDGKVTKEPTKTSEGEMTYTCKVCGETKREKIAKLTSDEESISDDSKSSASDSKSSASDSKSSASDSKSSASDSKSSASDSKSSASDSKSSASDSKSSASDSKSSSSDNKSENQNKKYVPEWFKDSNDIWHYRHEDGSLAKNEWIGGYWLDNNGNWIYPYKGSWMSDDYGIWYQDSNGWYPVNQWVKIDNYWHYFNEDGYKEVTSFRDGLWVDFNGAWDHKNYPYKGEWKYNDYGWWFEDESGWYPSNEWVRINGKWYFFYSSGYMAHDLMIDGYYLGPDGAWVE